MKEATDKKFGFKTLTLSNGATVIIKKTDYKADEVLMEAESKGGSSLYDQKDWANTELFDYIVGSSGLGEFDNTELDKALAGKQASVSLSLSQSYERLNGKSTVKDLETLFQLTYLKMTAIKKDEKNYASLMRMLETALKNKDLQPEAVFQEQTEYTIDNKSWRNAHSALNNSSKWTTTACSLSPRNAPPTLPTSHSTSLATSTKLLSVATSSNTSLHSLATLRRKKTTRMWLNAQLAQW